MGAAAKASAEIEVIATAAPPPAKSKMGLIIGLVVAVLAAAGGGAFFLLKGNGKTAEAAEGAEAAGTAAASQAPAQYLPLQPAFVVNLADEEAARYLQVEMEVMSRDAKALDEVKNHLPRIRNNLLLLLGSQRTADLATREGKEKLQAAVLADIQKTLSAETGAPGIEAVYFNSFVVQ